MVCSITFWLFAVFDLSLHGLSTDDNISLQRWKKERSITINIMYKLQAFCIYYLPEAND